VSIAAGLAAIKFYCEHEILLNCKNQGKYLFDKLLELKDYFQCIKEVRGKGLLLGLELTCHDNKNIPFPPEYNASSLLNEIAIKNGGVFYPGSRTKRDGSHGEHIMIAPPLSVNKKEIDKIVQILYYSFLEFESKINIG